jgi:hypothetical protein
MPTLGGQRTQFTWALKQYNITEDPKRKEQMVNKMVRHLRIGKENGWSQDEITQGKSFPAEVLIKLEEAPTAPDEEQPEDEIEREVSESVDTSNVMRINMPGSGKIYAYGYDCAPDRLKIGSTQNDVIQRIAAQINTSTPDKPVLRLEVITDRCRDLERALHAILTVRGKNIKGGGSEWFKTTVDEILTIYKFIVGANSTYASNSSPANDEAA